jgi:hypothetical protein
MQIFACSVERAISSCSRKVEGAGARSRAGSPYYPPRFSRLCQIRSTITVFSSFKAYRTIYAPAPKPTTNSRCPLPSRIGRPKRGKDFSNAIAFRISSTARSAAFSSFSHKKRKCRSRSARAFARHTNRAIPRISFALSSPLATFQLFHPESRLPFAGNSPTPPCLPAAGGHTLPLHPGIA